MQVKFLNYRCFRQTSLRLGGLTVILGPNASGKTSLLRALNPELDLNPRDVWQRVPRSEMALEVNDSPTGSYVIRMPPGAGRTQRSDYGHFGYQLLSLDPSALRAPSGLQKAYRLDGTGGNLINVFDTLSRVQQSELSKEFCALVPVFRDIDRTPVGNEQELEFEDAFREGVKYRPQEVSDGSILTLAFLLLRFQKPQVDVLAIEEPERALHPFLVERVITLLRNLAEGKIGGRRMHIVLTTHSPSTVDFCRPEEVRILNRVEDGSVEIKELSSDTANWREGFEIYGRSLGAVWMSGGIGGVPSS